MYNHILKKKKSQEFRLKNIDETRNYLIKDIYQNELISKKYKKAFRFKLNQSLKTLINF